VSQSEHHDLTCYLILRGVTVCRKFKQQWLTILPRPTTTIHMTSLKNTKRPRHHSLSRVVVPATLTQHLCQRSFYKIFVKFRNSKKNVLKIVLIIVNINKDENKLLISNQFSLKNDFQNLTLGYMTKTLNQSIFFFLHQNQNIFFSNIGNQNIFLDISRLDISHISPR
jgi:hypothetical protein